MMGASGGRKASSAVDDLLALAKVVSNDDTYRARVAELERLKAEADAARDESLKAAQAAEQGRQAQMAAANHNAIRLEEVSRERAKLDEAVQAFMSDKAKVQGELEAWSSDVQAGAEAVKEDRAKLVSERVDFDRAKLRHKSEAEAEKAAVQRAQEDAEKTKAAADTLKAKYDALLAGAATLLAQEQAPSKENP